MIESPRRCTGSSEDKVALINAVRTPGRTGAVCAAPVRGYSFCVRRISASRAKEITARPQVTVSGRSGPVGRGRGRARAQSALPRVSPQVALRQRSTGDTSRGRRVVGSSPP